MDEREPGFYWVRLPNWAGGEWSVAEWTVHKWWEVISSAESFKDEDFAEIGERVDRNAVILSDPSPPEETLDELAASTGRWWLPDEAGQVIYGKISGPNVWPEPQPITDAQKNGEELLLWDRKWESWDKGHWDAPRRRWHFPDDSYAEAEITHYLPLPPDVKP